MFGIFAWEESVYVTEEAANLIERWRQSLCLCRECIVAGILTHARVRKSSYSSEA